MIKFLIAFLCFMAISQFAIPQNLKLATYQYATNDRIQNITPLAIHLKEKLGLEVEVKSYPTVHLLISAIKNNEVDIALINTFGFLLLESSGSFPMEPLLALQVKAGTADNYKTAMVVPFNSRLSSMESIQKNAPVTKLMLVNVGSTSGNLVPRLALSMEGLNNPEMEFRLVSYGKTHQATIDSVALGKTDLAAVGSSEYFSFINNPLNKNKIKLLWLSPEIPLGPVLLNKHLSASLRKALTDELIILNENNPKALESVKDGWSEARDADKFIRIDSSYYKPFKKQLGEEAQLNRILKQFIN